MTYPDLIFLTLILAMIIIGETVPGLKYMHPVSDGSVLRCDATAVRRTDPRVDWRSDCWIDERAGIKISAMTDNPHYGVSPADDFCWTVPHCSKDYKGDAPQPVDSMR